MEKNVLTLLEEFRGNYVSIPFISEKLELSPEIIDANIIALKREGYEIDGDSSSGYSLNSRCDRLSAPSIKHFIKHSNVSVQVLDETGSTNNDLKILAESGSPEGLVLVARKQQYGKGRYNRAFWSPKGGIYLSILLRPKLNTKQTTTITCAAAVATTRAIEMICHKKTAIKWVNDIYFEKKKICGILTEGSVEPGKNKFSYVIVGIGINVCLPEGGFPNDIADKAGAIFNSWEYLPRTRSRLIAAILDQFFDLYEKLPDQSYLDEYRKKNFILGREIIVHEYNHNYIARALAIDDNCHLLVEKNGKIISLNSGEISIEL